MKKIIIILLLIWGVAEAQPVPGYTYINGRYNYFSLSVANTGTFHVPAGDGALLSTGAWNRSGALYYDSTGADSGLYVYHRPYWVKVGSGTLTGAQQGVQLNGTNVELGGLFTSTRRIYTTSTAKLGIAGTNGTDSGYIYMDKQLFTHNAALGVFGSTTGLKSEVLASSSTTNDGTNIRVQTSKSNKVNWLLSDSVKIQLYASNTMGLTNETFIDVYPDSISLWRGNRSSQLSLYEGYADQWARDSAIWRISNGSAHFFLSPNFARIYSDDSVVSESETGYYRYTDLLSTADSTTYKPAVLDINGKLRRGNSWGNFTGGGGASGLTVGTTTIASGTDTRVLYNNAGVLGEYTVTGTGTTSVLSTSPTFTTSAISPLLIGGTGTGSTLSLQSTSGVGATDRIDFKVGNVGATEAGRINTSGEWQIGSTTDLGSQKFQLTGDAIFRNSTAYLGVQSSQAGGETMALIAGTAGTIFASSNTGFFGIAVTATPLSFGGADNYAALTYGSTYNTIFGTNMASGQADPAAQVGVFTTASKIGLKVRGATSQSANLQEWQTVTPTTVASIDAAGNFTATNVLSGSYQPTFTFVTNISDTTAYTLYYDRVGNSVHVYGKLELQPTADAATASELGISLPPGYTSNFTTDGQASGDGGQVDNNTKYNIISDATNDRVSMRFLADSSGALITIRINFSYQIL